MGKVPDPLDLPSGGRATFGDPDHLFKAGHFRRLSAIFMPEGDGTVAIPRDLGATDAVIDLANLMAESLVTSWSVSYLDDAPIPRTNPAILAELSWPDLRAIGNHTIATALELAGIEVRRADGEPADPKGMTSDAPSASSGATLDTGSNPSSPAIPPPAEYVTPEMLSSLTSPTP